LGAAQASVLAQAIANAVVDAHGKCRRWRERGMV